MFFDPPYIRSYPTNVSLPLYMSTDSNRFIDNDMTPNKFDGMKPFRENMYNQDFRPNYQQSLYGDVLEDLNYLEQMYPQSTRKYVKNIEDILDKMDYDGSMIYDEFPDKILMKNLCDAVFAALKKDGLKEEDIDTKLYDMIYVLVCNDVFKRRQRHCCF